MMRRVLVVGVVTLLALDFAGWRVATLRLQSAYARWVAALSPQGWRVDSAPPVATGWPLAAMIRLDHARLGQVAPGGFAWSAERVRFGVSLLDPRRFTVAPEGAQALSGQGMRPVLFHAGSLTVSAPWGAPIRTVEVRAEALAVHLPQGEAVARRLRATASWATGVVRLRADTSAVALPVEWGLGRTVTAARIAVVGRGSWPGGTVEVEDLGLQWGALDVADASGTLRLDDALRPRGALDIRVAEPGAALAALGDAGAISRGAALAGQAVLALLAPQGGVMTLPLRLDAGTAYLGQIPLASVPALGSGSK